MKMPTLGADTKVILIGGGVALLAVWYLAGKAADVVESVADTAGGVLSGHNAITRAARTNAYEGFGVLGTLGAGTDIISGGTLSRAGEWLGGKIYDWTH